MINKKAANPGYVVVHVAVKDIEEGRKIADIPANLIRLCVGGEHPDDVIADLDQALSVLDGKKIKTTSPEFSAGGASSARLRK